MVDTQCLVCCTVGVKTKDLISLFGSVQAVRRLWTPPLTRSAIYQWGEEVPELRVYQLREKHPDIDARIAALYAKKPARRKEARAA